MLLDWRAPGHVRYIRIVSTRILLVEDHPLLQHALCSLLAPQGYDVRAATTAAEGLAALREWSPQVALVNVHLPDAPGFWLVRQCREENLAVSLAMLTAACTAPHVHQALDAGADGFLSKCSPVEELLRKTGELASGALEVFDEHSARLLVSSLRSQVRRSRLSPREREVLAYLADGATTSEIAASLIVSPHTVKDALRGCFKKLGVHDRAAAVAAGFRRGYLI